MHINCKYIINYDFKNYNKIMKTAIVYDGRNCYDLSNMANNDIEYYSGGNYV